MPGLTTCTVDPSEHAPRRLAGFTLIRRRTDEVLLIENAGNERTGAERWRLPGGSAEPGERLPFACHRLTRNQTGLLIFPERLLVVHQIPAAPTAAESTSHVFDGGLVFGDVTLADDLASYRWVLPQHLSRFLSPSAEWCLRHALDAAHGAPVRYLFGHPPTGSIRDDR